MHRGTSPTFGAYSEAVAFATGAWTGTHLKAAETDISRAFASRRCYVLGDLWLAR
jgi:hypothetical protein